MDASLSVIVAGILYVTWEILKYIRNSYKDEEKLMLARIQTELAEATHILVNSQKEELIRKNEALQNTIEVLRTQVLEISKRLAFNEGTTAERRTPNETP